MPYDEIPAFFPRFIRESRGNMPAGDWWFFNCSLPITPCDALVNPL